MSIYQYFKAKKCVGKASRDDLLEAQRVAKELGGGADVYNGMLQLAFFENMGPIHRFLFERIEPDGRDFGHRNQPLPRAVLKELTDKVRLAVATRDETIIPQYHVWYMDNVGYDSARYWERMEYVLPQLEHLCAAANTTLKGWSLCYEPQY